MFMASLCVHVFMLLCVCMCTCVSFGTPHKIKFNIKDRHLMSQLLRIGAVIQYSYVQLHVYYRWKPYSIYKFSYHNYLCVDKISLLKPKWNTVRGSTYMHVA